MIKKVTSREAIEQIHALGSYAFNLEHSEAQKEAYIKKNQFVDNYVDEVAGEVLSQIVCYPYEVTINGQTMAMAGIGDVATYPEARGSGGIRQLFEAIFKDLHEKGTELSYLAPFSQAFYRKFGYETVFDYEEIRIPKHVITQIKPEKKGYIKRAEWKDENTQQILKNLYKQTLGQEHGTLIREDYWWEYLIAPKKNKRIAICFDEKDQPVGYLIYGLVGVTEFQIFEMSYVNAFAMRKLMTFVSSHSGSFDEFVSTNLRDPLILELLTEMKSVERKLFSNMMVKIVNFDRFIEKYAFKNELVEHTYFLEVKDDTCEWNNGIFEVSIKDGKATCQMQELAPRIDYSGTIQRWTQVFMGHTSLEQAVWLELIEKSSTEARLGELIETVTPHLYDYF